MKIFSDSEKYQKDCEYQENGAEIDPYHNLIKSQSQSQIKINF